MESNPRPGFSIYPLEVIGSLGEIERLNRGFPGFVIGH